VINGEVFFNSVYAQSQYCSPENICVALSIPSPQNSGNPYLFATIQAPSSAKWFAIGFGDQMQGTLMLVVWPYNNKVIVSSRLATYTFVL
jgi:Cytochrome domain of cellobiose dehydrogenase